MKGRAYLSSGVVFALGLVAASVLAGAKQPVELQSPIRQPGGRTPNPGAIRLPIVVTGPSLPSNTIADTLVTASFKVTNLKPGTAARVTAVATPSGSCVFKLKPGTALPSGTVGADGFAFSLPGMFANAGTDPTGPCAANVTISGTATDGSPATATFASTTIRLAPPAVYVLTNTSAWLSKLSFAISSQRGTCSGFSEGPQSFRVGLIQNDGSGNPPPDITATIRSGPDGTRCTLKSQPFLLPQGVKLTDVRASVEKTSKCTAVVSGFTSITRNTPLPIGAIALRSESNPVMTTSQAVVAPNPNGAGLPATGLNEMLVTLACEKTLVNDHHVTLTIDSMTFVGQPGLTFP